MESAEFEKLLWRTATQSMRELTYDSLQVYNKIPRSTFGEQEILSEKDLQREEQM